MRTITRTKLLKQLATQGIVLDPIYPDSGSLVFANVPDYSRFWVVPADPQRRPTFIESLVESLGEWQTCWALTRKSPWPDFRSLAYAKDAVEHCILSGSALTDGSDDAVAFDSDGYAPLLTLIFAKTIFACTPGEDLLVVPDNGLCFLMTDHHGVIHATFRNKDTMDRAIAAMAADGYQLPDVVPDSTFKLPEWMNDKK